MTSCPKIFVVYHKPYTVFKNDVFEPIQTGTAFTDLDLGFLKDTGGDDIGKANERYGELTAWHWVLKNYLPSHPEVTHVGFCHYRRFLDFSGRPPQRQSFRPVLTSDFTGRFNSMDYAPQTVARTCERADILLPVADNLCSWRFRFIGSVRKQYLYNHPSQDLELMHRAYLKVHPDAEETIEKFLDGHKLHTCLNFVMKRDLFVEMATDIFNVLAEAERLGRWTNSTAYLAIRTPAFLVERFINVWISEKRRKSNISIAEADCYQLYTETPSALSLAEWVGAIANRIKFMIGIQR